MSEQGTTTTAIDCDPERLNEACFCIAGDVPALRFRARA